MTDEAEQVSPLEDPEPARPESVEGVEGLPTEVAPAEPAAAAAAPASVEPTDEVRPHQPEPVTPPVPEPVVEPVAPPPPAAPAAPPPEAAASPAPAPTPRPSTGAHMREVVRAKKQARLEKIVALAIEKRVKTNDDVQKRLGVSDATATNYLRELVRQGRLKKTGVRAGTRYETA